MFRPVGAVRAGLLVSVSFHGPARVGAVLGDCSIVTGRVRARAWLTAGQDVAHEPARYGCSSRHIMRVLRCVVGGGGGGGGGGRLAELAAGEAGQAAR